MDNYTSDTPLKRCSKGENCIHPNGPLLPATTEYFHINRSATCGLQSACKTCKRDMAKRWNADHAEKVRENVRLWRINNPEKRRRAVQRQYRNNPQRQSEATKRYRRKYPEKARAVVLNRRARRLAAGGSHTDAEVVAQYNRQHGECYYCGINVENRYHVDHVIPIVRGGTNDISNLVITCPSCNLHKGDKLPHEWQSMKRRLL